MALKVVVWDFDGVVFDSMHLKGEGFKELFRRHTKADETALKAFEDYHYANGGVSRFDKIAHFYTQILKKTIDADKINALVEEFGHIIEKDLFSKEHLNLEVMDFVKANHEKYIFHIASAALHTELQALCAFLGISPYFKSIEGAPPSKAKVLANLCTKYGYKPSEMVLIGDSKSDYESARVNKITFLGYNNPTLQALLPQAYISRFANLDLDYICQHNQINSI
ncbi:Haloacid dehalogenase [Helicobacter sp. NHP19-012]|uniref:phosphoglycolate phosphatase n=1 Tax=Helicobacter gastrofelis TaxID=2849642 RepID=A0ABN6I5Y9_9HELI|nr:MULTISPECIES: HAD family hydrolase [unclassified Helicobacter]BCZ19001.1 Haloacid dehalogenase [Helicobacter sp. NHP19-012]GMB96283.1 Haloacid dehalogenase [Helicobacter sp. NHP22-001]